MSALRWLSCAALLVASFTAPLGAQEGFRWEQDLATAQRIAAQSNRLLLLHFGATWCAPCQVLEREVINQPGFGQGLGASFVGVKLDVDHHRELAIQLGVERLPTDVVVTHQGQVVQRLAPSPSTAAEYAAALGQIAAGRGIASAAAPAQQPTGPVAGPLPAGSGSAFSNAAAPVGANPSAATASNGLSDDRYASYFNRQQEQPTASSPAGTVMGANAYAPAAAGSSQSAAAPAHGSSAAPYGNATAGVGGAAQATTSTAPYGAMAAQPTNAARSVAAALPTAAEASQLQAQAEAARRSLLARRPELAQIPAGSPPLALDGFCPVTLAENRQWHDGDIRWGAVHRGRTYLFSSAVYQQRFLANPDRYSPVNQGNDPVLALERGIDVPGRREHGVTFGEHVYLFATEASLARFSSDPERYASPIVQAMRLDGVRRQ